MGHRMTPIVEALTRRRIELGITQNDLAAALGTTRSMIVNWEKGHHSPNCFNLELWAQTLGCVIVLRPIPKGDYWGA